MCDAAAVGEICSSPAALAFLEAFRAADGGRGIACLYGNYSGDNMNVKMAVKMAKREGLTVKTVVANDDVASAPKDQREKRRGVAGEIFMWKCAGAKAAKGGTLDEVISAAQEGDRPLQKRWDRPDPMYSSRSGASEFRDQRGHHGGRDRAPWGTGH